MARFRFELEAALTQRRAAERAQQVAVSMIERERIDSERSMREWNDQLALERLDLRERLEGGDPSGLRLARFQAGAALNLVARLRQGSVRLAGVYARLEKARNELVGLAAGRQAVEKLREQRLSEWKTRRDQKEWSDQDDLASCGASSISDGPEVGRQAGMPVEQS